MGFGIPDFGEIEQLGKNLVAFMSNVNIKLDIQTNKQKELSMQLDDIETKLDLIISTLKEKP
jgi:hypothetical protein